MMVLRQPQPFSSIWLFSESHLADEFGPIVFFFFIVSVVVEILKSLTIPVGKAILQFNLEV